MAVFGRGILPNWLYSIFLISIRCTNTGEQRCMENSCDRGVHKRLHLRMVGMQVHTL